MKAWLFAGSLILSICVLTFLPQCTRAEAKSLHIPPFRGSGPYDTAVVSPDGKNVYVIETDYFGIAQFRFLRGGKLVKLDPFEAQADAHPSDLVFDPSGRHAYVSCSHGDVIQYRIARNGQLIRLNPPGVYLSANGGRDPSAVVFDKSGRYATVAINYNPQNGQSTGTFRFRVLRNGSLSLIGEKVRSTQ